MNPLLLRLRPIYQMNLASALYVSLNYYILPNINFYIASDKWLDVGWFYIFPLTVRFVGFRQ